MLVKPCRRTQHTSKNAPRICAWSRCCNQARQPISAKIARTELDEQPCASENAAAFIAGNEPNEPHVQLTRFSCPLSHAPFVQSQARGHVPHSAVGAWIEERDEALSTPEMAVSNQAQRIWRRFI